MSFGFNITSSFSERHKRLLEQAMALIAERGFASASLRELARRVSLSQPSLYHYFDTKDQLIEQIIEMHTYKVFSLMEQIPTFETLEQLLGHIVNSILTVYEQPDQITFVRFAFTITVEKPRFGDLFRRLLVERVLAMNRPHFKPFVDRGDLREEDVDHLLMLTFNALVLKLIHERVLFGGSGSDTCDREFASFVVDVALHGVLSRRD